MDTSTPPKRIFKDERRIFYLSTESGCRLLMVERKDIYRTKYPIHITDDSFDDKEPVKIQAINKHTYLLLLNSSLWTINLKDYPYQEEKLPNVFGSGGASDFILYFDPTIDNTNFAWVSKDKHRVYLPVHYYDSFPMDIIQTRAIRQGTRLYIELMDPVERVIQPAGFTGFVVVDAKDDCTLVRVSKDYIVVKRLNFNYI